MQEGLKVVFMGTPEFAAHSLEEIYKANFNIVGVITATDKPAGRGKTLRSSAVKQKALELNLNLLQPPNLKEESFINELKALHADVFVVVAFRMLPKQVWQIPNLGTFNLHASLLPQYRGAAPINWAIINGETKTGVTTFLIDEKIDTGNILLSKEIEINDTDNAGALHDKLMQIGSSLIIETLNGLKEKTITPKPQEEIESISSAPKIFKEQCKIDWSKPLEQIHNLIRGMSPYPGAFTTVEVNEKKKILKVFEGSFQEENHNHQENEIILENNTIKITHPKGYYLIESLQLEGKKRMTKKEFLNGFGNSRLVLTH